MRMTMPLLALLAAACNVAPELPANRSDVPEAGSVANAAAAPDAEPSAVATPTPTPAATPAAEGTGPSFDCTGALSRTETLVCNDSALARLDRLLARDFAAARAGADVTTRNALRESQRFFLARRDACDDAACVAQSYRDRIDDIPATVARAPQSCRGEIGEAAAQRLVRQCRDISPATHPPCNAANSCAMIEEEIARSCAMFEPDDTLPAFCRRT